jgi:hypothetical protein
VVANGTIVNANQDEHPDLYFALRGGGNNFGIVTRLDFETHRSGSFWGGTSVFLLDDLAEMKALAGVKDLFGWNLWSISIKLADWVFWGANQYGLGVNSTDVIQAFVNIATQDSDPDANAIIFFTWVPWFRSYVSGTTLTYSKPEKNPEALNELQSLPKMTSTNRIANMSDFCEELEGINMYNRR